MYQASEPQSRIIDVAYSQTMGPPRRLPSIHRGPGQSQGGYHGLPGRDLPPKETIFGLVHQKPGEPQTQSTMDVIQFVEDVFLRKSGSSNRRPENGI